MAASSCLCSSLTRDTQISSAQFRGGLFLEVSMNETKEMTVIFCLLSGSQWRSTPENHHWWLAEVFLQCRGSPTEGQKLTKTFLKHSTLLWTACCLIIRLFLYCVCWVWVSTLRRFCPQINAKIWSCYSMNAVCRTLLFVSSAGLVSLKLPSGCCDGVPAPQVMIWITWVRSSTWCPHEHHRCLSDFPRCYKICERSLLNKSCCIDTKMEKNAGRRGGVSSWTAIIPHQRLIPTTEIAIFCQLTGLCQWTVGEWRQRRWGTPHWILV